MKDGSAGGAPTREEHVVLKEQGEVKDVVMMLEPEPEQGEQDEGEDQRTKTATGPEATCLNDNININVTVHRFSMHLLVLLDALRRRMGRT